MENIISATIISKADAIHPGFGFLSENTKFVQMCERCKIIFIGPPSDVIHKMGDKSEARATMMATGVPVVPGTKTPIFDAQSGTREAALIGYPVMIKAAFGGGGKGMRIAYTEEVFAEHFNTAQMEALNAFGDNTMYLEKYMVDPRHIEVQILADKYGNVIYLGERDCSIQRRHQKILEESPSCALDEDLRNRMGAAAKAAAKAVNYENAGTIEFLLDKDKKFYFMEMNTRIQVEHPVTEMVTGIDLIKEQIKIAAGLPLAYTQEDIKISGHAIECRINAENPEKNFRPSPGTIEELHMPGGHGIRVDSAIYQAYKISPYYDSMIAKLIVKGENREDAIHKMQSALGEFIIQGIDTNIDFLFEIIGHEKFREGDFSTGFIETMNELRDD